MTTPMTADIQGVFELVDREIWIVTAAAAGHAGGLVATWVSAASIDPQQPTVLIGLAPNHFTAELVQTSGAFALHLFDNTQLELVWRFALSSGRNVDKLAGLAYEAGASGSPLLTDCLAWLDCRVIARYDAGDRLFFWGDVIAGTVHRQGVVLRERQVLAGATAEQRAALAAARSADIAALTPLRRRWLTLLNK